MIQKLPESNSPVAEAPAVSSCPVCGASDRSDFFQVKDTPVHVGILWDTAEQARRAPKGDITLAYCHSCGFVQNRSLDPAKLVFKPGYEVALHHSQVFRDFTDEVATRLIQRYQIRHRKVLEIGCGCGYFLRRVCDIGQNDGIGIDPTVVREGSEQRDGGNVQFIRDYFTDQYTDIECDLICCLSVFEDIPHPVEFVGRVRQIAERRQHVPVYFEVFNGQRALESCETWSIHYEQCNYFSLESLSGIFRRCGFAILDSGPCYQDGQYLFVEAMLDAQSDRPEEPVPDEGLPATIAEFGVQHETNLASWERRFDEFSNKGSRAVVWGSGGKGISFLNALDASQCIHYVIDINPDRQGKYIPGSAQRIVDPSFLTEYRPDVIILTNILYEQEIKQQVSELGLTCEFHIA